MSIIEGLVASNILLACIRLYSKKIQIKGTPVTTKIKHVTVLDCMLVPPLRLP